MPEVLACDVPAEVPGDALGADESEDLGVIVIRELEVPGQECHALQGDTRYLKHDCHAQAHAPSHDYFQSLKSFSLSLLVNIL